MRFCSRTILAGLLCCTGSFAAEARVLDAKLHHLRRGNPREWSEFPEQAARETYEVLFSAEPNQTERSLRIRQQDVKQTWSITLNDKKLGQLRIDENDMILYFPVAAGMLVAGENRLTIMQDGRKQVPDDIRVGEVQFDARPIAEVLNESTLEVEIRDEGSNDFTPARITVVAESGALQTVGASSDHHLAVRPGTVYTSDGRARFGLPAGRYRIYAGRGFEYSLASSEVELRVGTQLKRSLTIRRQVPTPGYVACDTHVHTLSYSGHGDATIEERMITLAGEAIELPIATDHNVHVSYEPKARELGVRRYFTPVMGNEVTTPVGHFNVFAVAEVARIPNAKLSNWPDLFDEIYRTPGVRAVILNHARDLHAGVRPFGPALHNRAVGKNVDGAVLRANAMEVINSGATQSDPMQLFHDWMTMLNHGRMLTPVGSSDSHDVSRHFVGQGRTYIRARDEAPGSIDVEEAVANFVQGRVMVSYGLLAELKVNGKYGPGEIATAPDANVQVEVRVLGPDWVRASTVEIFANGKKIKEHAIEPEDGRAAGIKWSATWDLPRWPHDVHLVAIARGPGVDGLYWKTAKPYQPESSEWHSQVIGCSGAIWLDIDGDGRGTPAYDYARRAVCEARDLPGLVGQLTMYDEAVAIQAADLWQSRVAAGGLEDFNLLFTPEADVIVKKAAPATQAGFQAYFEARRETDRARSGG